MERNVTIQDTLQENVDSAIEDIKDAFIEYCESNSPNVCPDFNDLDYNGTISEIVDSATPIYTSEIEDTWYLYRNDIEEAYENHGIGDNPLENNGMTAIYCYIMDQVWEWFRCEAEDVFDEWKENSDKEEDE